MALELFEIFGKIGLNGVEEVNGQLGDTTNKARSSSSKMVSAFKKIGGAVATYFAVDKIKDFGKATVDAAADVAAEEAAFEQIMGDYAENAQKKLNQVASSAGITSTRMTGYMTSLSAKFKGLGYGVEDATSLAARGLNIVTDGAAFWDKSLEETTSHLNSFINGSYEGGEAIGLFANDTQMAMFAVEQGVIDTTKSWANLDEATKQATRLEYAEKMYALSGATGQAAKESGAYLNVQGELTEAWRQFKAAIGAPILENVVIPAMQRLSKILPGITARVGDISEKFISFAGDVHEIINEWVVPAIGIFVDQLAVAKTNLQPVIDAVKNFIADLTGGITIIDLIRLACKGFETAMAYLGIAVVYVSEKITEFFTWIQSGTVGAEAFKAVIVGITAAFLAYKTIMIATKAALMAVEIWTKAVTTAQTILNAVLNANPIMIVIIALTALAAAFIYLWNNCEEFRNFWIELWEDIKVIANNVAEWFKTAWADIVAWFQTAWNDVSAWFSGAVQAVTNWFKTAWEDASNFFTSLWEGIKSFLVTVWDGIIWVVQVAIVAIGSILQAAFDIITIPFRFIWENCKEYIFIAWDWIVKKITSATTAIGEFLNTAFTAISEFVTTCWNGISKGISVAWDWIAEKVTSSANSVSETVTNVFNSLKEFVITCWNGIKDGITTAFDAAKEKVIEIANTIKTKITTVFNNVKKFVTTTWNNIKSAVETPIKNAKEFVSNSVDAIKTNVTNGFNAVKTKVTSIWNNIKSAIKTPIEGARDLVKNAINSIKGFFDFEFKWPKLKLPHFSFTGSWNPFDWPDKFPKLGVDWYAKGGILNSPTLFGISPSGNAMIGGEAGAEAVAPIDTLMSYVSAAVKTETDGLNYNIQKLISMLSDYMPQIVNGMERPLVLDTGAIVGGIARNMDGKLGDINRMKGRGN